MGHKTKDVHACSTLVHYMKNEVTTVRGWSWFMVGWSRKRLFVCSWLVIIIMVISDENLVEVP